MLTAAKSKFAAIASTIAVAAALAAPAHVLAQELRPLFRFQVQSAGSSGGQTGGPQNPPAETLTVNLSPAQATLFVGQPYVAQASVSGHAGPVAYALIPVGGSTNTLNHLGLTFDRSTGTLSGTLAAASGVFSFQVRATDPATGAVGTSQTVTVQAVLPSVTFSPGGASGLTVGVPFSSPTPSTNVPSPTFSPGPFFPAWASLDAATGVITGTPTIAAAGYVHPLNVQVTNGTLQGSGTYSVSVNRFVGSIVYSAPVNVFAGQTFTSVPPTSPLNQPVYSADNSAPFPAWLSVNPSNGVVSGTVPANTPSQAYALMVFGRQDQAFATGLVQVNVLSPNITLSGAPTTVTPGTQVTISASSNLPSPVSWSMTGMPSWLSINSSTGQITGSATSEPFTSDATIVASSGSLTASTSLRFTVENGLVFRYGRSNWMIDRNTTTSIFPNTTGGTGAAKTYTVSQGALPTGLSINQNTGRISGTTTAAANSAWTPTISVTDGTYSATFQLNFTVQAVTASYQCFGPGSHTYIVPSFNSMSLTMNAAGGAGGGVINNNTTPGNSASGGNLTLSMSGQSVTVYGGLGGGWTTLAQNGATPTTNLPPVSTLRGGREVSANYAGVPGTQGFKANSTPQNPGRGGFNVAQAETSTPYVALGSGSVSNSVGPSGPGVGGAAQCYAPTTAQRSSWANFALWCGSGGGSGGTYNYVYNFILADETFTDVPRPGTVINVTVPGAPSLAGAGSAGEGSLCITIQ